MTPKKLAKKRHPLGVSFIGQNKFDPSKMYPCAIDSLQGVPKTGPFLLIWGKVTPRRKTSKFGFITIHGDTLSRVHAKFVEYR